MDSEITLGTLSFNGYHKKKQQVFKFSFFSLLLLFAFVNIPLASASDLKRDFATSKVQQLTTLVKSHLSLSNEYLSFEPCLGGSGVVGGLVFQDFNYNGLNDQAGPGLGGIEVYIFGCDESGASQLISNTITSDDGTYFFSGLTDGQDYRVEFHIPRTMPTLQSGFNGEDSRTTVQFVSSPDCSVDVGLVNPADYCEEDPSFAVPCYVNGDPLAQGSGSANEDALVLFKSSYENSTPAPTTIATAEEIGATWGIAYQKETNKLFVSALLKRHVGLGSLGLGGIYQVDLTNEPPVVSNLIDVNTIGINVGSYPSNSERGLTANINLPNNDTQAFDEVGKRGLGGLSFSEEEEKLYLINLTEKKLHAIDISDDEVSSNDVESYDLPNPNCTGGAFRPFAVKYYRGTVYVGGVCDAETSGEQSDLRAIIYRLDGSSFTEVLNFDLDYDKGNASRSCGDFNGWFPWTSQLPPVCFDDVIVYPTPQLTAIEFDESGDMIIGFTDRMGNQLGFINYPPEGTDATFSVFTGGDILKAGRNIDGSFTLEENGTAGSITTEGANNGEGPGGGEFYHFDVFEVGVGIPRPHSETAQGGLAVVLGSGDVATTALDPFGTTVNSGGVNYLNNVTGEVRNPGYKVFQSGTTSPATFSKANGLGDLEALCGLAPLEIGGRLWNDVNQNGIQDPCEVPISGIAIALYNMDGQVTEEVETDANGEYFFNGSNDIPIVPNSDYYVVIGFGGQVDNSTGILLDSFLLTVANTGIDPKPDLNDSDAFIATTPIFTNSIQGWPVIMLTTGDVGSVSHDNDAGFYVDMTIPTSNIQGTVWEDIDKDGQQDQGEPGIEGVTVTLQTNDGTIVATTTTDENGDYEFTDIEEGLYIIEVNVSTNTNGINDYVGTAQNVGDDALDSDVSPGNGQSMVFNHSPSKGSTDIDAGFIRPSSNIEGTVWEDEDRDGQQDQGEPGIEGVTVTLQTSDGMILAMTTTDENGDYEFEDVEGGDYIIEVNVSTNTNGIEDYAGTAQNVGDDALDSDVSPSNGQSMIFTHEPSEGSTDIDAGFIRPSSNIEGTVWEDEDRDGQQDQGEPGIEGVTVTLQTSDGMILAMTTTDENGDYEFEDVEGGDYIIEVNISTNTNGIEDYAGTAQNVGDDALDSDVSPGNGQSMVFTHEPSEGSSDIDAGFIRPSSNIEGTVWEDEDRDGQQDQDESGIEGVTVTLQTSDGMILATTTTDENGDYEFEDVEGGDYIIEVNVSTNTNGIEDYAGTAQNVGDDALDSDVSPGNGQSMVFAHEPSEGSTDIDAGFIRPTGSIRGVAFDDKNQNGLQDEGESRIEGVTVTLQTSDGTVIATTTTDTNGQYEFMDILSGDYVIVFDISTNTAGEDNYEITLQDAGDDTIDSDINTNNGSTAIFSFDPTQGDAVFDGGYFIETGELTGVVFIDANQNGLQDEGEATVEGVEVVVIGEDGTVIGTATTLEDGTYTVENVPSGIITVIFDPDNNSSALENLSPTIKDVNGNQNDDIDSDINLNSQSDPIVFDASVGGAVDAGYFEPVDPVVIGDFVFKDCNANGIQDEGETGVANILITLTGTNNLGEAVKMEMTTNAMGRYTFILSRPGEYMLDFDIPEGLSGLEFSPQFQGDDDALDSDVNPLSGVTETIVLSSGQNNFNIDVGLIDRAAPIIFNIPPDVTVSCNDIPDAPDAIKGVDNCDPSVDVLFSEQIINEGNCPYIIERTWSATDRCGNSETRIQEITVTDDEAPVITLANPLLAGIPNNGEVIFECDELPEFSADDIIVVDNCSGDIAIEFIDLISEQGDCAQEGYLIRMTCGWIATDECGNQSQYNIVILVVDTKAPVLQNIPADQTINLDEGEAIPSVDNTVEAIDNCDEFVRIDFEESQQPSDCGFELLRTWTAFDNCGNKTVETQRLTLLDDCSCPAQLVSGTSVWDVACDGSMLGIIQLDLTADLNRYTISISPDLGTKTLVGNRIIDLPTGDYTVTVNYEADEVCFETYDFTIGMAEPAEVEIISQTQADCGASNGTVSLAPADFQYNWSDGGSGAQRSDLIAGMYEVTIIDNNQCQSSITILIDNPDDCDCVDLQATVATKTEPSCYNATDGQIDIEVTGGLAPYSYTWNNGQTTEDLMNIGAGTYAVTITDANGCSTELLDELVAPNPISIVEMLENSACDEQGAIDIFVEGGTAPYTFVWSNGATTEDLVNLVSGIYSVIVTDSNNCQETASFEISNSGDITLSLQGNNPICGGEMGSIQTTINGGIAPFTYEWSNGATTPTLEGIPAGTYAVMITDATGCSAMAELTLDDPSSLLPTITVLNPNCFEERGAISVSVIGGVMPYSYEWSFGATTPNINDLEAGSYDVTITDANGCAVSLATEIIAPPAIIVEATASTMNCDKTGNITLEVISGAAPYSFVWSNGSEMQNLLNVATGTYIVTVTDATNCTRTQTIVLEDDCTCELTVNSDFSGPDCEGNLGFINLDVMGGLAPYTFVWDDENLPNTPNLENLQAGTYTVTVTDANGCSITKQTFIEAEDCATPDNCNIILSLQAQGDLACYEDSTVSIGVKVLNGTMPYFYRWNTGEMTDELINVGAGTYSVEVRDANGCKASAEIAIDAPDPLIIFAEVFETDCDENTGAIDITTQGGTPPYTYLWNTEIASSEENQSGLSPGDYELTVTDSNDCLFTAHFTVESCSDSLFGFVTIRAARMEGQEVEIIWETKNELEDGYFTVLHSTDGNNFRVVGQTLNGKGPIDFASYQMLETAKWGMNYYQIKYFDNRENQHFSEQVEVLVTLPEENAKVSIPAILYPNPTEQVFTVDMAKPLEVDMNVSIFNVYGILVEQRTMQAGLSKQVFDLNNYESGVYQVILKQKGKRMATYRIIKATE